MDQPFSATARGLATARLGGLPQRLAHVKGVAAAAALIADSMPSADSDLLVAAAWVHDIGYAGSIADTGFHPLDGARFLHAAGYPEIVVSLVAFHSEATVEAGRRGLLADLSAIARPPADLLDALTTADMTTSPTGTPVTVDERLVEILDRYDAEDPVFRAVSESAPLLRATVARVQARGT